MEILSTQIGRYFTNVMVESLLGNRGFRVKVAYHQRRPTHTDFADYAQALDVFTELVDVLTPIYIERETLKHNHDQELRALVDRTEYTMENILNGRG